MHFLWGKVIIFSADISNLPAFQACNPHCRSLETSGRVNPASIMPWWGHESGCQNYAATNCAIVWRYHNSDLNFINPTMIQPHQKIINRLHNTIPDPNMFRTWLNHFYPWRHSALSVPWADGRPQSLLRRPKLCWPRFWQPWVNV